jgi:plasmid stabilization system protein ParE
MSLPVILRPEAESDVQEIYESLEQTRERLGNKFLTRLREMLERIESFPEIYGVVWQDVRAGRLKKFRYVVYYVVFPDRIEIIAVMHGARRSSTWRSRR